MNTSAYARPPAIAISSAMLARFDQNVVTVSVVSAPNHDVPADATDAHASRPPTINPATIGERQTSQCLRASHKTARMQPPMPYNTPAETLARFAIRLFALRNSS